MVTLQPYIATEQCSWSDTLQRLPFVAALEIHAGLVDDLVDLLCALTGRSDSAQVRTRRKISEEISTDVTDLAS